jgi:hypothetical protein
LDKRQACNARENPYPEQAELSGLLQVVPVHEYQGFKAQNQGAKARRAKKIPDAPARPGRRKADSLKVSTSSPRPEESIARIPERFGAAVREISNPKKSARNTIVLSGTCHARKNGRNRGSGALTKARADFDGGGGELHQNSTGYKMRALPLSTERGLEKNSLLQTSKKLGQLL